MNERSRLNYLPVLVVLAIFVLITMALIGQNVWVDRTQAEPAVAMLERSAFPEKEEAWGHLPLQAEESYECLFIWDSMDGNSVLFHNQMNRILRDMKISGAEIDIRKDTMPDLKGYGFQKIVIGFADYEYAKEMLLEIMPWVKDGGQMLIALIPEISNTSRWMRQGMGVIDEGTKFYETTGIRIKDGFMLTGGRQSYPIGDSFQSSRMVVMDDDCTVFMESDDSSQIPLVWAREYGQGRLVVVNLGIYEKAYRGIYSSAYSLLGSACVYPVINASSFFIDDFPPPFLKRTGGSLMEKYQMNTENFYSQLWWRGMSELAEKYDIPFTATILESYDGRQKAPFEENENTWQYQYFGSLILDAGGEIGLHGYNHMPLVLESNVPEETVRDYKGWKSTEDMQAAMEALHIFSSKIFPNDVFQVYVPPLNLLSEEGRDMLLKAFPWIRSVAGIYLPGGTVTAQEFEVRCGLIDTPRIAFGYEINDNDRIAALSELNLHFVSTHCQYPESILENADGENRDWEELLSAFTEYVEWIYKTAPCIRSMTGSELASAVQRFYYLDVHKEEQKDSLILTLDHFVDEAWLMARFNDFVPDITAVEGGTLTRLEKDLYLLKAENEKIVIRKSAEKAEGLTSKRR